MSMATVGVAPWQDVQVPPLPALPAMTGPKEWQLYYWLTAERFRGRGAVVEVGCFLGASTIHLAAGLRDRGHAARVVVLDHFVWMDLYDRKFASGLAPGDSFEALFRANTAFLADHIELLRADLREFVWDRGPIEILVVDAPKLPNEVTRFLAAFGPALIPNGSVVAFQDYLHPVSYSLPLMLHALRDRLELIGTIPEGSTAIFEVRAPLLADAATVGRCWPADWTATDALETWEGILERLPPAARKRIALSLPMLLHDIGAVDLACERMRGLTGDRFAMARMRSFATTSLFWRYRPLFDAVGVAPDRISPEMLLKLSVLEKSAGRRDAAIAACRQALAIAPDHVAAQERLRRLLRRSPRMRNPLRRFVKLLWR
ncbi:MAG TPA: class I SAM-dependent methyltransferase [Geminicoccaceae bacterium]|nr:class I SAM-dependent methyltransferase [Geminicoccaceae bacterium]